jgi:hypothetical protein
MATNSAVSFPEAASPPTVERAGGPLGLGQQPFFDDKNRAFWILQ